jgi:hypothetical protein
MKPEPKKAELARLLPEDNPIRRELEEGTYNEWDGPLSTPIISLVGELRMAGYKALMERVVNGDFDDEPPE